MGDSYIQTLDLLVTINGRQGTAPTELDFRKADYFKWLKDHGNPPMLT